jgi:hypothetical protein
MKIKDTTGRRQQGWEAPIYINFNLLVVDLVDQIPTLASLKP